MQRLQASWLRTALAGLFIVHSAACFAQDTAKPAAPAPAGGTDKGAPADAKDKTKQAGNSAKKAPQASGAKADSKEGDQAKDGKKPDKKDAKADDAKAEEEGPDADTFKGVEGSQPSLFELGYSDWGLSGSRNKFLQYATPPQGVYLREFRLRPLHMLAGTDGFLGVKSIGQPDYVGEANLGFFYGNTRLAGYLTRNRFFDPTPSLIPASERRTDRAIIRQQLWKDFSLSFTYRNDDLFKNYQEPTQPTFLNSRYRDMIAGGRVGNGYLSMKFLEWNFVSHPGEDRRDVLDSTLTRALRLGYLWNVAPTLGLEGAYTRTWIYQPNAHASRLDTLLLDGDLALGSGTNLDLFLRQQHAQLPIVQNAFVRDSRYGALRVSQRVRGWTASGGLKIQEAERVRGDHTFVDVPRWTTFDGKLTGRMFQIARVTLRGSTQSLEHPPVSSTQDTRSLYWSNRDTAQLKIDLSPSPSVTAYGQWAYKHWRNDQRFTSLTNHNLTFGGDWQATPAVDFFAEYTRDMWGARGEHFDYPQLNNFVPDSQVSAIGMNWAFNPRTSLSVSYSDFATVSNDNPLLLREGNTHGSFLTINAHYTFPRGYELGFILAPWSFRDNVVQTQDYDATVVMITGAARF